MLKSPQILHNSLTFITANLKWTQNDFVGIHDSAVQLCIWVLAFVLLCALKYLIVFISHQQKALVDWILIEQQYVWRITLGSDDCVDRCVLERSLIGTTNIEDQCSSREKVHVSFDRLNNHFHTFLNCLWCNWKLNYWSTYFKEVSKSPFIFRKSWEYFQPSWLHPNHLPKCKFRITAF